MDDIQKLHVRVVPLGAQPRRVAHCSEARCIAVAVEAGDPGSAAAAATEAERNYIQLFSDTTFERGGVFRLEPQELALSLAAVSLPVSASSSGRQEFLVAGTAFVLSDEDEPSRGRVLVLRVDDATTGRPSLHLVAQRDTKGGVFALAVVAGGHLAAGVNGRVSVLSLTSRESSATSSDDDAYTLTQECSLGGHTLALYLDGHGDFLLVGDLMKSISLLRYEFLHFVLPTRGSHVYVIHATCRYRVADNALEEVAAEPSDLWMTAVAMLDETTYVGAQADHNLFTGT